MANSDVIWIPVGGYNSCRTVPQPADLENLLGGSPGVPNPNCNNPVTGPFSNRIQKKVNLTPNITVDGLDIAITSLRALLQEVQAERPDIYNELRADGMLCVRYIDGTTDWSNHAFGAAIDLYFGPRGVIPRGCPFSYQGILDLYPYFRKYGWAWGGGYRNASPDSMHFEISLEALTNPGAFPQ